MTPPKQRRFELDDRVATLTNDGITLNIRITRLDGAVLHDADKQADQEQFFADFFEKLGGAETGQRPDGPIKLVNIAEAQTIILTAGCDAKGTYVDRHRADHLTNTGQAMRRRSIDLNELADCYERAGWIRQEYVEPTGNVRGEAESIDNREFDWSHGGRNRGLAAV